MNGRVDLFVDTSGWAEVADQAGVGSGTYGRRWNPTPNPSPQAGRGAGLTPPPTPPRKRGGENTPPPTPPRQRGGEKDRPIGGLPSLRLRGGVGGGVG